MTQLPTGWTYEDPYIDVQIRSRAAQLTKLLEIFRAKTEGSASEVTAAAERFIQAQDAEAIKLPEHTFGPVDQDAIAEARQNLDRVCDIPN